MINKDTKAETEIEMIRTQRNVNKMYITRKRLTQRGKCENKSSVQNI